MQTVVMDIPAQGAITSDNVTLKVDAVVYFRVVDPVKAIINVEHYPMAVSQVAQTSLRAVIGRADLDTLLSDRDRINAELKAVIDGPTEGQPWPPTPPRPGRSPRPRLNRPWSDVLQDGVLRLRRQMLFGQELRARTCP